MRNKLLLCNLSLVLFCLVFWQSNKVAAQDTLYIEYNEEGSKVTLQPKGKNICFKPNGAFEVTENLGTTIDSCHIVGQKKSMKVPYFDTTLISRIQAQKYDEKKFVSTPESVPIVVNIKHKDVAQASTSTDSDSMNGENLIYIIFALLGTLILVLLVWWTRKKRAKKERHESIEKKGAELGLEVVEVVSTDLEATLNHVRQSPYAYYTIDVARDFRDTAVRKIYLHHSAIKKMYDFFKGSLESAEKTNETGCYFIGCWEPCKENPSAYNISVEDIVEPGDDIDPGEFSFSFGKKIGVKLDTMISQMSESTNRDYVHTVWMHSHPGLGLFLSSHDLLVQKQLAYTDAPMRMAAFVIDTNTPNWDFAIFTSKTNGTMNNKEDLARIYSLDELYQWSRTAHARQDQITPETVAPMTPDMDNYYVVQINHQGTTRTLNLYFSGKTINTMDDILYQYVGQKKLGGYLIGTRDGRGNYLFDDCSSEKTDSAIGILVIDAESTPESVVQFYCGDTTLHCVVVCRDNDEMWILTRETNEKTFNPQTGLFVCSMRPMKEWLRRKRVYK